MKQIFDDITIPSDGQGIYDLTPHVKGILAGEQVRDGLLTLFCRHTSCSLIIQENADPDVMLDLRDFLAALAPRGPANYRHNAEGPDDMPAHIKTMLTQTHLSIPVEGGHMMLGTWQGLFLLEHRDHPHDRQVRLHYIGE